ncbi:hypothetical protein ACWEO9_21010, partial [Streptomyces albidoflavus]
AELLTAAQEAGRVRPDLTPDELSPKGGVRGQQRWYNRHMASSYRTNDGHTVRIGSTVWGVNGQGPFTLVEPESAPEGWVSVVSADGEDWRLHAPEDIALYYVTTRP